MDYPTFISFLKNALDARLSLFDARKETAFRLFNGFTEGEPDLVVDLYTSLLGAGLLTKPQIGRRSHV